MLFNGTEFYGVQLELGRLYNISFNGRRQVTTRLIQPTPKGFNFLNLKTHKCVLKRHLYPSKFLNEIHNENNWFTVMDIISVRPV